MPWTRRKFIKTVLLSGTGLLLADSLWAERVFIETNEFSLSEKSLGIKIVQLSDLHLQSINSQLKKLAKTLNALKPDLILFTGDSVDSRKNVDLLNQFLGLLDLSISKAAILGNWEYWGNVDLERLKAIYEDHNCCLLINESKLFNLKNKSIAVTGTDDFVGGKADIDLALTNYVENDYHIILNHCPEYSEILSDRIFGKVKHDLILSGHTHGGQFNLFGFAPFKPQGSGKYLKGWYKDEKKNLYVSKGIGTSVFPARFMARAEFAVFNI